MLTSVISSTTVSATTVSATTVSAATTSAAVSSTLASTTASTVSSTLASSTTSAAASSSAAVSAISMTTNMGLPEYGVLAVIALIVMLSAKEILSASSLWNRAINCSMNMSIMPLLFSFSAIVCYKVFEII